MTFWHIKCLVSLMEESKISIKNKILTLAEKSVSLKEFKFKEKIVFLVVHLV